MDRLYKTLICNKQVSLSVTETTSLVQRARDVHGLDASSAKALGELLTCGVYMSGCLKSERGAISITIKGSNGRGSASVSGDIALHMRGYINGEGTELCGGFMTVIKEDGFFRPFTGACELISDDVSRNMEHYFELSEQIPTKVRVGALFEGEKCLAAGGIVMQLLPDADEAARQTVLQKEEELGDVAQDIRALGAEGVLKRYFEELTRGEHVYMTVPQYKCNCSREKVAAVLRSMSKQELQDIVREEGAVSVHCHYCNTDYKFGSEDIDKLFE